MKYWYSIAQLGRHGLQRMRSHAGATDYGEPGSACTVSVRCQGKLTFPVEYVWIVGSKACSGRDPGDPCDVDAECGVRSCVNGECT